MLQYDRFNISKRMVVNKSNKLNKCIICKYYKLFKMNFRLWLKVCEQNALCYLILLCYYNVAIVSVKGNDHF